MRLDMLLTLATTPLSLVLRPKRMGRSISLRAKEMLGTAGAHQNPTSQPRRLVWGAVCIDGDTAAVGARTVFNDTHGFTAGSGVVYIYQREGKNFVLKQKLSPEDAHDGERFGFAVDLSGDTLVVGSPFHGDGGGPDLGVAYAYVREKEGFQHQRTFIDQGWDRFGWSVAIDRDTIVIGAPFQAVFNPNDGVATIYVREGKFWEKQAWLWAKDGSGRENFGWSVAVSGNRVIIGSPNTIGTTPARRISSGATERNGRKS